MVGAVKVQLQCLDCEQTIDLPFNPVVGQIIACPNCDAEFEVIDVDPVEIDWAFFDLDEEDEDWDDDFDDDSDED